MNTSQQETDSILIFSWYGEYRLQRVAKLNLLDMILTYFKESWQLTKANIWVLIQSTILLIVSTAISFVPVILVLLIGARTMAVGAAFLTVALLIIFSVIPLTVVFPTLVTGLEGMYLKAKQGKTIIPKDVFMYRKKFRRFIHVVFRIGWLTFLIGIPFGVLFLVNIFLFRSAELLLLLILGASVFFLWWEGQHLHALNLVAENDIDASEALSESRELAKKHHFSSALLSLSYLIILGSLISDLLILQILGLMFFPIVVGATAMAYFHEIESSSRKVEEPN